MTFGTAKLTGESETEPAVAHSSRQIALYAVRAQYLDHDTVTTERLPY